MIKSYLHFVLTVFITSRFLSLLTDYRKNFKWQLEYCSITTQITRMVNTLWLTKS